MSSIHETRTGSHELRWRENGKPKTLTRKTRAAAEREQEVVDRRLAAAKPVVRRQDAPTLEAFSIEQLALMKHLEETTLADYALLLEAHVFPFIGHLSLIELRPRRLQEWQIERLAAGAGPSSIGKTQVVLSLILKKAVLPYEYLDADPSAFLDPPGYKKKPHRWLTAEEVEAIRGWYLERDDVGSATLISVQAYVGIRPQDTLARTWPDLSMRPIEGGIAHELSVTTKNVDGEILPGSKTGEHKKRRVYVPEATAEDLELWRPHGEGVFIFGRASDGKPWTKSGYRNWRSKAPREGKDGVRRRPRCFKAAAEDLGLGSSLRPYDLRHTFATLAANAGWTADEIAHQLGNGTDVVNKVYRHMLDAAPRPEQERRSIDDYIRQARDATSTPAKKPIPA
jgi:integrase